MEALELTGDGAKCTICSIVMKSKKPSNLREHIDSKIHRKNAEKISRVGTVGCFSQLSKESPNNIHEQNSINHKSLSNEGNASRSTQPTVNCGLFLSPSRTKQQELEEKIFFLEGRIKELFDNSPVRSHFTISDLPSGVGSANKLAQDDFHKQCNKLIEELKTDKNKLEQKIEDMVKEQDDLVDRSKTSLNGLNKAATIEDIHKLCKEAAVTKDTLIISLWQQLNDLKEREAKLDKERTDLKEELRFKEAEWLEMFKDLYTLSKKPDFHKELKDKLKTLSKQTSKQESSCSDLSQDGTVADEENTQTEYQQQHMQQAKTTN